MSARKITAGAIVAAAFGTLAVLTTSPAEARIVCRQDSQIINGQAIITPYCADDYLAKVARSYGMRVTAAQMRNSLSEKARVCRFIGHDLRVKTTCSNYRDENSGPGLRF